MKNSLLATLYHTLHSHTLDWIELQKFISSPTLYVHLDVIIT